MDTPRRAQLVMDVLQHAVNGDHDRTVQVMGEIAAASTGEQMYGVCCAFAEAARQTLVRLYGHPSPEGLWALAAPDPADGPQHPAHAFSLRFITAYANGDMPTCQALYLAAASASADDFEHSVVALVGDVAHLACVALQELAADSEKPAQHPH
ncbi:MULTISPECIES: hypothetical protein [unclassified Streptomyces]|uniref:hypothetical protein n=1 Tax=unclassified Streptomyces TaxID=2593676 RepID=UPI002E818DC3|nr:hypothetical protein [Streptomyces sp. NBC_00589]WTI37416.1 hypothetical protein OIC96_21570 [Streptomyces sp. NBC_00775]WUB28907.1 hypothetical protein OHA51_28165 [Streptomyces sp. NBC_00589]